MHLIFHHCFYFINLFKLHLKQKQIQFHAMHSSLQMLHVLVHIPPVLTANDLRKHHAVASHSLTAVSQLGVTVKAACETGPVDFYIICP